jgi:hypothetical protein
MKSVFNKTLLLLAVFSIAMGFLETAVVVYLRELLYPQGFQLPLMPMKNIIILTELLREAATIIMLAIVGYMAGKNGAERFGYFIFCFAVWDICYYIFLKLLLNWPATLGAWDILFLIPIPWVGPVAAPVIVSLTLICWCMYLQLHGKKITWHSWISFATGSAVIIFSFTYDYWLALFNGKDLVQFSNMHIPQNYQWWVFAIGQTFLLFTIYVYNRQSTKLYAIK